MDLVDAFVMSARWMAIGRYGPVASEFLRPGGHTIMNTKNDMLAQLVAMRDAKKAELDRIVSTAEKFGRSLSGGEATRFEAISNEIREYDAETKTLREQIESDNAAAEVARKYLGSSAKAGMAARKYGQYASTSRIRDESVYTPRNDGPSFFKDLYAARSGDWDAQDRLRKNNEQRAIAGDAAGKGTEFVPPLWLEDQFIAVARPGRITADLCAQHDMPPGTDSINVPRINTGTQVAAQNGQNSGVQQTDLTTNSVASPVITVAGGQTVSLQLIEQSPINIDNVVLSDLAADYARQLNAYVLGGTGSAGQFTGLTVLSGIHAVDFPSGTPTSMTGATGLYATLAGAISSVHSSRYAPPDAIIMHPRRWQWACAAEDNQNRPLVVPDAQGAYNSMGVGVNANSQGYVGKMLGLPVFLDAGIPLTGTADSGSGEDYIIVARMSDNMLFESQIKAEAFQQTYAQNMSVFVRLYAYSAFVPRYATSIALVTGSGLAAPTF